MMKTLSAILLLFCSMSAYSLDGFQGVKFNIKKEQFKPWGLNFKQATYTDLGKGKGASLLFMEPNGLSVLGQRRTSLVMTDDSGAFRSVILFMGDYTSKAFEHLNAEIKNKYKLFRLATAEESKSFNSGTSENLLNLYENGQIGVFVTKGEENKLTMVLMYQCAEEAVNTRKKYEKPIGNGL